MHALHVPFLQARPPLQSALSVHAPPGLGTQRLSGEHWSLGAQSLSSTQGTGQIQVPCALIPPPEHCASEVHPPGGATTSGTLSLSLSKGTHGPACPTSRSPWPLASIERKYKLASHADVSPTIPRSTMLCK